MTCMRNSLKVIIIVLGLSTLVACTTYAPAKSSGNARIKVITYADNNAYKAVVERITRDSDGSIVYRAENRGMTQLYVDLKAGRYTITHTCKSLVGIGPEYNVTFDLKAGQFVKMEAKIVNTIAAGVHCKAAFFSS